MKSKHAWIGVSKEQVEKLSKMDCQIGMVTTSWIDYKNRNCCTELSYVVDSDTLPTGFDVASLVEEVRGGPCYVEASTKPTPLYLGHDIRSDQSPPSVDAEVVEAIDRLRQSWPGPIRITYTVEAID